MIANLNAEKNSKSRSMPERIGLYQLEEEISRGYTSVVYRAVNVTFQYKVALKVLHPELKDDDAIVRYFVAEGQDAAQLIHPNIVRVYDAGLSDGFACIAQAYVDGLTLTQVLRSRGRPLALAETLRYVEDISGALEYAHSLEHIHGNLKPGNIFRNRQGHVLVTDFQVANPVVTLRPASYPGRQSHYRSPEQRSGDMMLTPMSDVFSLALIVFEMLTGHLPYGVDDSSVTAPYIHGAMLANVQVDEPHIREDLAQILNRALTADPAHRYSSVASFTQAITGAAQNRLDTLKLSASATFTPPQPATTALMLYKSAPLAVAGTTSRAQVTFPRATKEEQKSMSWISLAVGSVLLSLLVIGAMNTMTLMFESTSAPKAPDPQILNTVIYTLFERSAALLNRTQIMDYFSPFYGLVAAVVLLVLLFQRELLRTFGTDADNRYWQMLGYAIPPATVAFVLLVVLQIFRMMQAA